MQEKIEQKTEQRDRGKLVRELQEKLDWYTMCATEEEYDEKAVESILYLLDALEPMEEDKIPNATDAWQRFEELCAERELQEDVATGTVSEVQGGGRELEKLPAVGKKTGKIIRMFTPHRGIVAAVLLILVLAVTSGVRIEAVKNSGFFHWLKRDKTGQQMVTTSESLNGAADAEDANFYYSRTELPDWTKAWAEMENAMNISENFRWQRFDVQEFEHYKNIKSLYRDNDGNQELAIGMVIYLQNQCFNTEIFGSYSIVNSYEVEQKPVDIYKREEETGKLYYRLCYWEDNCMYYIQGSCLEELRGMMERYLNWIK